MKVKLGDLKLKNGKTIADAMRFCINNTGCSICEYNQMVEFGFIFNSDVCDDKIKLDDVLNYEVEVSKVPAETTIEAVKQSDNKKVYICSPYRGDTKKDTQKNAAAAVEYCRYAIDRGVIPIAPHIYFTQFLNDDIPEQREFGLQIGLDAMSECSEVWVFGDYISAGMKQEIEAATAAGQKVVFKHIPAAAAESEVEA